MRNINQQYFSNEFIASPNQMNNQKRSKKRKGKNTGRIVALAFYCSLIGGAAGAGGLALGIGAFSNAESAITETSAIGTKLLMEAGIIPTCEV